MDWLVVDEGLRMGFKNFVLVGLFDNVGFFYYDRSILNFVGLSGCFFFVF